MADRVEINMSRIKIAGLGGLGMLLMPVVAYGLPAARQFLFLSYGAGVCGALLFIAYRKWIAPERPHRPTLIAVRADAHPVSEAPTLAAKDQQRSGSSTYRDIPTSAWT